MWENIERIIRLLKPKYYDGLTYIIVITGTSLVTKPIWLTILNSIILSNDKNNEILNIYIVNNKWDPFIGILLIAGSLYWNTKNRLLDIKSHSESLPAYLSINGTIFDSFEKLCENIYPLLNDNEYIFKTVGPNSGANSEGELRFDLTMWNKYKVSTILPNNSKIKMLLKSNSNLFSRAEEDLSNKMILHIDAFEEHCSNANFDYNQFRFPIDFKNLIENTCYNVAVNSKIFIKRKKWLNKKFSKLKIDDWYITGSSLFTPKNSKDMDIVILTLSREKELLQKIKEIRIDFKLKFKLNLHETVFFNDNKKEFNVFLNKNNFKMIGNG